MKCPGTFYRLSCALLFPGALAFNCAAAPHYVAADNSAPVSPFTNWITAATNIQDAIDAANAGDFIVVSNGIYQNGGRTVNGYALTNRVVIDQPVTVESVNGPASTIIAGLPGTGSYYSFGYRCVYLTNGAALIGFTLTNGATSNKGTNIATELSGGSVWCESGNAVVSNCVVTHSYAQYYGGGAYGGTFDNCLVSNNTAFLDGGGTCLANLNNSVISSNKLIQGFGGGGALYGNLTNCLIIWNGAPQGGGAAFSTLTGCVISNNVAGEGGGLYGCTAINSLISSNVARSYGGGGYSNLLVNCLLQNNWANSAGGACLGSLANCLLIHNSAVDGGAVAAGLGFLPTFLENCTISENTASDQGGGLLSDGLAAPTYLFATNCIVYGNSAPTGSNYLYGSPGDLVFNACCTAPLPPFTVGNIAVDPVFINPAGGDFHLQSNSPCINSGNNAGVLTATDLDGNPRIAGGTVDTGAYEYQSPASVISYAYLQQYGLPTDGSVDFTDLDGTGFDVNQDWIAGLNPTNPASILAMQTPSGSNNTTGVTVSWQSVNGILYFLQRSTNLSGQPPFTTIRNNLLGQPNTTSFTDTTATNAGPYLYRVGVQ